MKVPALLLCLGLMTASAGRAAETNLVANGSFEESRVKAGVPDDWSAAGGRAVKQELTLDTGRDGKRCARLVCSGSQFVAIAWCEEDRGRPLKLGPQVTAYDIMGNEIPREGAAWSESPVYLIGPTLDGIIGLL
jgi:hypothetical protein